MNGMQRVGARTHLDREDAVEAPVEERPQQLAEYRREDW